MVSETGIIKALGVKSFFKKRKAAELCTRFCGWRDIPTIKATPLPYLVT